MRNSIFLIILTTFLLYIGSEVLQTRNAAIETNTRRYTNEEIEFTKYGPSKSDIKKALKENQNQNIIATLSGEIDEDMTYFVDVSYSATLDKPSCKKHDMWNGIVFKYKSFTYHPKINGTTHSISIPLKEVNPKKGCQYKVHASYIQIYKRGEKRKGSRYVLFSNNKEEFLTRGFRAGSFDFLYNKEVINVECLNPSTFPDKYYYPCGSKPLTNRFAIVKRFPPQSVDAIYNISELQLNSLDTDDVGHIIDGSLYDGYKKRRYKK